MWRVSCRQRSMAGVHRCVRRVWVFGAGCGGGVSLGRRKKRRDAESTGRKAEEGDGGEKEGGAEAGRRRFLGAEEEEGWRETGRGSRVGRPAGRSTTDEGGRRDTGGWAAEPSAPIEWATPDEMRWGRQSVTVRRLDGSPPPDVRCTVRRVITPSRGKGGKKARKAR